MSSLLLFCLSALCALPTIKAGLDRLPDQIHGVNLGSWLLVEPWMLQQEWVDMGGQHCDDCSTCLATEYAFAKAYPETVDAKFAKHWDTWFNQKDVDQLKSLGINAVRIPLGYWLVEPLIEGEENFPRGGIRALRRGLKQLKNAGIIAVLDHHALPGAQAVQQQFAGRCTREPQFYTPHNYHRALVWTAVMTVLSHLDPNFESVVSIQAVNEQLMNATLTPGYGEFTKNFVQVVRAVELGLGIPVPRQSHSQSQSDSNAQKLGLSFESESEFGTSANITADLGIISSKPNLFNAEVRAALVDAVPALLKMALRYDLDYVFKPRRSRRESLITNFMDMTWQWTGNPANPADAEIGPQAYDNHLYYNFGGVADHNPEAYLHHLCNLDRVQNAINNRNIPLWFGEWSLATGFEATDEFLKKWADAQKLQYSKDAGWFFWNFKIEISELEGATARQWSYLEGVRRGYLTRNPAAFHDPKVCDPYVGQPPPSPTSSATATPTSTPTETESESAKKSSAESSSSRRTSKTAHSTRPASSSVGSTAKPSASASASVSA